MKYTLLILTGILAITLFSLCSNPAPSGKTTQKALKDTAVSHPVTLTIDSGLVKTSFANLFFYYHDSLYQSHGIGISKGQASFYLNTPAILIDAVDRQTPYLVNPGENIHIKNPGTDSVRMFIPGNAVRTYELDFLRKMVRATGDIWYFVPGMPYHKKVISLSQIQELELAINDAKTARLKFLETYARQFPISKSFINTAAGCIRITAISDSLYLYRRNQAILGDSYKQRISAMSAAIGRVGFMPNQFYYRACTDLVEIMGSNNKKGSEFIRSFDFIDKNFVGLTRDYLLAKAVYSDFKNKVPISKDELSRFDTECKDPAYRSQIHRILKENSKAFAYAHAKGSNKLLSLDGKTVKDLDTVLAGYKGKLVLFDFWASWCSPCRAEMPYTDSLKKVYKDRNIVFVSISTDANIADWKSAARDEALTSANDFLLLNADQASFMKKYSINSIPRYMLIGKDGKVIHEDAPRPSDQQLRKLIDRLL